VYRIFLTAIMVLCLLGVEPRANGAIPVKMKLEPSVVTIGASYNGAKVIVSGEIPRNAEALVTVNGREVDIALKKKERVFGFLWMNLGTVIFHKVPNVYLVYTDGLDLNTRNNLDIGFEYVKKQLKVTPPSEDKEFLFDEFLKLKEKEGLYGLKDDTVHYGAENGSLKSFTCILSLPPRIPQGIYKVEIFAIKDGKIIGTNSREVKVEEVGLPKIISTLAFEHGTLYGVLATLVAIVAGLLMGFLFKGGKGAH